MRRPSRFSFVAVAATLVATATGCSIGGDGDGYEISAHFARTVALYEQSDVTVMGIRAGEVTAIDFRGDEVVVTMRIDDDVPLPADATAAIAPESLIGERNVVLTPWKPGDERLADGAVIPLERTIIPVEPDEALQAVTDLVQSLDPQSVNDLLVASASALDGNGAAINRTLIQLATLLPYLAEQDDELLALAGDLDRLAAVVDARDAQIGRLLDDFATVAGVLAEEREAIITFVEAMTSLTREGQALLTAYEVTLPDDLDELAELSLTIKANASAVQQIIPQLLALNIELIDAYDGEYHAIVGRGIVPRTMIDQLVPIFELLGIPVPCVEVGGAVC